MRPTRDVKPSEAIRTERLTILGIVQPVHYIPQKPRKDNTLAFNDCINCTLRASLISLDESSV